MHYSPMPKPHGMRRWRNEMDKERREELREKMQKEVQDSGGCSALVVQEDRVSCCDVTTLLDLADERDRYRALLVEARRGYLKDGTIFAREVDAALEGKHD